MKVTTVDENKIEIMLSNDEIDKIFGGYSLIDYDTPDCRIKIHNLLAAVMPEALLPLDCERILIEVKPQSSGCTISLTKLYKTQRRRRQPCRAVITAMIFETSENLIAALPHLMHLNIISSELYCYDRKYAIIAVLKNESYEKLIQISEFCILTKRAIDAIKLKEYWNCITPKNAIQKLSDAFLK